MRARITVLRRPLLAALAALLVSCGDDAGTDPSDPGVDASGSDSADATALDGARDAPLDGRDATSADSVSADSAIGVDAHDGGGDALDSGVDSASADTSPDGTAIDASAFDTSDTSVADTAIADTRDAAPADTADASVPDTADAAVADTADAARPDTADASIPDTADAAMPDTADGAAIDPCSPLPSGLTTWTKSDSASVGTPDTYFFDVTPGDPFCATITGGGGGTWSINASNGTSSGVYCSGSPKCSIIVPASTPTLLVTAITTDIGGYTLTVRYRPR
jgi:hypothetical protein